MEPARVQLNSFGPFPIKSEMYQQNQLIQLKSFGAFQTDSDTRQQDTVFYFKQLQLLQDQVNNESGNYLTLTDNKKNNTFVFTLWSKTNKKLSQVELSKDTFFWNDLKTDTTTTTDQVLGVNTTFLLQPITLTDTNFQDTEDINVVSEVVKKTLHVGTVDIPKVQNINVAQVNSVLAETSTKQVLASIQPTTADAITGLSLVTGNDLVTNVSITSTAASTTDLPYITIASNSEELTDSAQQFVADAQIDGEILQFNYKNMLLQSAQVAVNGVQTVSEVVEKASISPTTSTFVANIDSTNTPVTAAQTVITAVNTDVIAAAQIMQNNYHTVINSLNIDNTAQTQIPFISGLSTEIVTGTVTKRTKIGIPQQDIIVSSSPVEAVTGVTVKIKQN